MGLDAEAVQYLKQNHSEEIDALLVKIATILFDCEVDDQLTIEIAEHIADIAAINFTAGIEFGDQRPEAARRVKERGTRSYGVSSSNGG